MTRTTARSRAHALVLVLGGLTLTVCALLASASPVHAVSNQCPAPVPDALDDVTVETVHASGEETLQSILNNAGYSLDVQTDQKQYQVWHMGVNTQVEIDTTFINKYAAYSNVFGYYLESNLSTFVPIFKTGDVAGYEAVPFSNGGPFTINVPSGSTIGFAIKSYGPGSTEASENTLNPGGADQMVAYDSGSNAYVLAFEDIVGGDYDYNDVVVAITLATTVCEPPPGPEPATLRIVKDAVPNDLIDFSFDGGGILGVFMLDDDAGVADKGLNGDTDQPQSKVFADIPPVSYTITETEPNAFWVLQSASCVQTGTAIPYPSSLQGTALTVSLGEGVDVTCTFVNRKDSPTRTLGFWQTHTAYTSAAFASYFVGGMQIGSGIHKGLISNLIGNGKSQLFGAWYASISKKSNGKTTRLALDQARMQLLQQLVAAKLNCVTFGCAGAVQTLIANADSAYAGASASAMLTSAGLLDAYNKSGDTQVVNGGSATPKDSQGRADRVFWDAP